MKIVSSLKNKIILAVSFILAVTIGLGTWINIGHQRLQMESALADNMLIIANTIEKSLSSAMLQGKSREVQSISDAVGSYHNIKEVNIFSPNGVVLKSSSHWMIGRKVDPALQKLFLEEKFNTPIKRKADGLFTVLFPLKNEEACHYCHGAIAKINGVLSVNVSMAQTQQKVSELS